MHWMNVTTVLIYGNNNEIIYLLIPFGLDIEKQY